VYAASLEVVGAIGGILDWLTDAVPGGPRSDAAEIVDVQDRMRDGMRVGAVSGRLNPSDVLDALVASTPESAIVTTDVGSHKLLVGQGWPSRHPRRFLVTNGLSAMGFALPAGIAAKLAHPERPVVVTVGDGGFAMVPGELQLASSLRLDLLVVVLVDESLNRIELKQMTREYPSIGTRLGPSDIAAVAAGMGCDAAVATSAPELERVLAAPRASDRPLVVEARIDPAQYLAQFS
jgi:acetolactate synthase-1/2/3 large subunit